jgi:hypothetical protein
MKESGLKIKYLENQLIISFEKFNQIIPTIRFESKITSEKIFISIPKNKNPKIINIDDSD